MMRFVALGLASLVVAPATAAEPSPQPVVTGPPVSCINLRNIRGTQVIDDQTIDFHMAGNKVFRNTLPNRCAQLGFQRAFAYQTSVSQLCSVDIITVIVQGGGSMRGATCGLGKFTPMEPAPRN
jgi:hypothetical protein